MLGHIGRIRRWCGIPGTLRRTTSVIEKSVSERLGVSVNWASAIARGCDIDTNRYIARHSMLPFSACVGVANRPDILPVCKWPESLHGSLLSAPLKQAIFCRRCVEEQLARRPFAVWRRFDHLPFRFRCDVHDLPLLRALASDAHTQDPSMVLSSGDWTALAAPTDWVKSKAIRLLDEISMALLHAGIRWPGHRVSVGLRRRARLRNIRFANQLRGPLLSDQIYGAFPSSFLTATFPSFQKKVYGRSLASIDGLVFDRPSALSRHLCLALAVLHPSASSALRDLNTPV